MGDAAVSAPTDAITERALTERAISLVRATQARFAHDGYERAIDLLQAADLLREAAKAAREGR